MASGEVKMKSFGSQTWLPCLTVLIGTYGVDDNKPNLTTAAWVGISSSKPSSISVSFQTPRAAFANINAKKAYTICVPSDAVAADYCGMVTGKDPSVDKFAKLGWKPVKAEKVDAPYPVECPMVFEMRLIETHNLGLHTEFVGEIVDVKVREDCLDEKGRPDCRKCSPIFFFMPTVEYFHLGDSAGQAFNIGKSIKDAK